MRYLIFILGAFVFFCAPAHQASAHALQPGYLEIKASGDDVWRVVWRKPDVKGAPMAINANLPDNCTSAQSSKPVFDGNGWTAQWIVACPGGLAGGRIAVPGLEATQTDVLVRYEPTPGDVRSKRLTPTETFIDVKPEPGHLEMLNSYFWLGVDHILEGIDHLLFVFALLLLIPDRWRLVGAITAFTVAHSITLAAVTLGYLSLPGPPVETVIALSIMFLASELLQREEGQHRLSERYPWVVSFAFGLLHGFGFAGALAEIGLPRTDVPMALLSFNLGVEAGQLFFLAGVLLIGLIVLKLHSVVVRTQSMTSTVVAYMIGGVSAYWFIDRLSGFSEAI